MNNHAPAWQYLYQEDLYAIPSPVLVILGTAWETLQEDQKNLLIKILASVKLQLSQVQIINKKEFALEELPVSPARIIAFGAVFRSSGQLYEHVKVDNVSLVVSDDLTQLDDAKKKALWQALKKMFEV